MPRWPKDTDAPERLTPQQQAWAESCVNLAQGLAARWTTALGGRDEALSVAYERLTRAALKFDPARGFAFTTFAHHVIRMGLIAAGSRRLARSRRCPIVPECDTPHGLGEPECDTPPAWEEAEQTAADMEALRQAVDNERWWRVLHLRYALGLTLAQVGAREGVSKEMVRLIIWRARRKARRKLLGEG